MTFLRPYGNKRPLVERTKTLTRNENDNLNVNLKPETAEGLEPETNLSVWEEGNRIVEREGVTVDRQAVNLSRLGSVELFMAMLPMPRCWSTMSIS